MTDRPPFPVMQSEVPYFPTLEEQIQENIRRGYLNPDGTMTPLGIVYMEYTTQNPVRH